MIKIRGISGSARLADMCKKRRNRYRWLKKKHRGEGPCGMTFDEVVRRIREKRKLKEHDG